MGKSALPVGVPVTPKLTPEVLEDMGDDEGGWVDKEEGIEELTPVWPFTPRIKEERKKGRQEHVACANT